MPAPGEELRSHFDENVDLKALLTALIDGTTDLIWSVDPERFAIQSSNRSLREHLKKGWNVDIRPGMTPEEVLPTRELAELWKGDYRRALRDGPFTIERDATMGGLVLELHFSLLERDGRVFGVTVFGRDVTARQRATDQLRRSEAFFRSLQEASPDLSVVIGDDGRYRFVSSACTNVLGYSVEEVAARPPLAIVHQDDRPRLTRVLEEVLEQGGTLERQRYRVRHRDGSWRHLESVLRDQRRNPDVAGVLVNTRDVTEQVALATRVQHVREEEKTRIARDLHDRLGQLLTGLKLDVLWLEERLEELPATPLLNSLVERTVAASELAEQTIAEVQRIATELRPAALDRLGLGAALQQEGRRFQGRTGIPCRVEVADQIPAVTPDAATALYRIAQESLTNVARHARASHVVVRLRADGGGVVLEIEDDGVGIEPGKADEASSIGLAGMRERAALEGGELTLHRGPAGGTRVEVHLPVQAAAVRP